MSDNKATAIVLAGGGSHGAVQVGMLKVLAAERMPFDFIVGASAGAINAAWFAHDPTESGVAALEILWRNITRSALMPLTMKSLWNLVTRADSIFDGSALRALLSSNIRDLRFQDAVVPLHIVATNLLSGTEVVLSHGSVIDALMASTAIPGIFPAVRIGDTELVDGGVANNTPISTAVRLGAKRVIVLPTGHACALSSRPRGAVSFAMNALNHLVARQLVADIDRYCRDVEIIVAPSLCPLHISSYDYTHSGQLIDNAAAQTRAWLDNGGGMRCETPEYSQSHIHDPAVEHRYHRH